MFNSSRGCISKQIKCNYPCYFSSVDSENDTEMIISKTARSIRLGQTASVQACNKAPTVLLHDLVAKSEETLPEKQTKTERNAIMVPGWQETNHWIAAHRETFGATSFKYSIYFRYSSLLFLLSMLLSSSFFFFFFFFGIPKHSLRKQFNRLI